MKERYYDEGDYKNNRLPLILSILEEQIASLKNTPSIVDTNFGVYYTSF